jgi:hypothetical protein
MCRNRKVLNFEELHGMTEELSSYIPIFRRVVPIRIRMWIRTDHIALHLSVLNLWRPKVSRTCSQTVE